MKQPVIARLERGEQPPSLATLARITAGTGTEFHPDVERGKPLVAIALIANLVALAAVVAELRDARQHAARELRPALRPGTCTRPLTRHSRRC